ncbi:MAG: hypothetical protein H7318_11245 [Oligoflexus sp.]|nr:hypothetical protein [Oligoflexus sp.]
MKLLLRLLTTLLIFWNVVGQAEAADLKAVPSIKYAGILPVYWQGDSSPSVSRKKSSIEEIFVKVVRESKRYTFLNDSIVADNWSNTEGRKKLEEEYELDAFLNLNVTEQGDIVIFTARLLSPELENYVSETDRLPIAWVTAANEEDLTNKIRDLSFRVLNRYPIDVFVTSLQGRYITLSSGKDQNVLEGDSLEFADFAIKSQHPVDGTWLEFEKKPLGKAKIVESKSQSSIALITSLNSENAIKIGSGARVENIASRRNFRSKPAAEESFVTAEPSSPIVTAPGQKLTTRKTAPLPPVKGPVGAQAGKDVEPTEVDQEPMHPAARAQMAASPEESADQETGSSSLAIPLTNTRFSIENDNWNYSGPAKASSKMPSTLINRVGAYAEHDIDSSSTSFFDAYITSGETKKGSYFGMALAGEFLYKIASLNTMIPSLDRLLIGGRAEVETIGTSKESFGGMDGIHLAPVVHAQGNYHIADLVQTYGYDVSAKLLPFNFGSTGIKGKTQSLGSGMGLDVEAQVLQKLKTEQWEWGGLVALRQVSWDVSTGSLAKNSFRFGLLARVKL